MKGDVEGWGLGGSVCDRDDGRFIDMPATG